MNVYSLFDEIPHNPNSLVTVGTFDGVHIGHQHIINRMKEMHSTMDDSRIVVVTFDPHPQTIIPRKDKPPITLLSSIYERLHLLEAYGVSDVVIIPFSKEFSDISSEDFIRNYIFDKIGVHSMFIGHDHGFGKQRQGSEATLKILADELGFSVHTVEPLKLDDTIISSTLIRKHLQNHALPEAFSMLGYPYFVEGIVHRGDERGRKLGIPTANIQSKDKYKLYPAKGVYFVSSEIDGELFYGMANIGTRPTFTKDTDSVLEVNYFGLDTDLYDKEITVWFLKYLREEKKFESVDLFLSQLYEDRSACEELIEQLTNSNV